MDGWKGGRVDIIIKGSDLPSSSSLSPSSSLSSSLISIEALLSKAGSGSRGVGGSVDGSDAEPH